MTQRLTSDLFISYRRRDAEQVLPLIAALGQCGLSVWLDQHAIGGFAPSPTRSATGSPQSKGLLAWYSEAYSMSRPCQMELTAAFLAAQREGDPQSSSSIPERDEVPPRGPPGGASREAAGDPRPAPVEQASLAERGRGGETGPCAGFAHHEVHDAKSERRKVLREAIVAALTNVLSELIVCRDGVLAFEVQHARALLGPGERWDCAAEDLAAWVARHDYERGLYVIARPPEERALEARRRVLGDADTLTRMDNLATTLYAQGDWAAERVLQEGVLQAKRQVLGNRQEGYMASAWDLFQTLLDSGNEQATIGVSPRSERSESGGI